MGSCTPFYKFIERVILHDNYFMIVYHVQHRVQRCDYLYFFVQISLRIISNMAADNLMSFHTFEILYPVLGNVSKMDTQF